VVVLASVVTLVVGGRVTLVVDCRVVDPPVVVAGLVGLVCLDDLVGRVPPVDWVG